MSPSVAFAGKKGRGMGLPQCMRNAKKIDFGVPISGYLCCAEFQPPCVIGVFFQKREGGFRMVKRSVVPSSKECSRLRGISSVRRSAGADT